jgi:SAM-dependent methyltransferase/DNA-binding HxlR family transcriptional regulator
MYIFVFTFMNASATPPILDRLSVLGDETRTRILALLERGEFTVTELCSVLQAAQPTVSRHLKTLASEGWVEARVDGRNRHYRVSPKLDESVREVWKIVRGEIGTRGIYTADSERAVVVLDQRRMRSTAFFAETAEHWDAMRAELFGANSALAPMLGLIDPGWVIGDLGVGTGSMSERLAPFASRVIGVDRSDAMLETAAARLGSFDNVELRKGDLETLPMEDGELDLAILGLVLHYVADPLTVLAEVHRVLRPGGRLMVLDMRPHEKGVGYSEDMGHVWPGFESERLQSWLEKAEFVESRVVALAPDPAAQGPALFVASATA